MIPTIKVNLRRNPSKSFDGFKKSMEKSLNGMKEIFPDFKYLEEPIAIDVNGRECVYASCTYTLKAKNGEEKVKVRVYAIPVADTFYQITFMESEKENNAKLFDELIKTVVID